MQRIRIILGMVLFMASVILLIWSVYPTTPQKRQQNLQPILLQPMISTGISGYPLGYLTPPGPASRPFLLDDQQLILRFPEKIRFGETWIVQLTFRSDKNKYPVENEKVNGVGLDPSEDQVVAWSQSYRVIAEARLGLPGMDVRPSDLISEPLHPGGSADFYWSIKPRQTGEYRGTVWLYLRIMDLAASSETRQAISAQIMEIEAVDFYGHSTTWVQVLAGLGLLAGVALGLPIMNGLPGLFITNYHKR